MAREVDYIEIVARATGQQELQRVGGIVDELMKRAKNAGVSIDDLAEKMKKLGKKAGNTQPYNNFISSMKQIAGITAVGMGIKKSISMFTAFDDVARRVQGTTGANAETMELLRYQAKELGRTTSWSASEAAEAQFEFAKAGFTNNEILAATSGILDTATAAQMGLAEATEITAGALRMFGLDASKSTQVGDMLTKTASSTSTDVRGLAESLKYSGNGARQFGLSLEQTLGMLGQLGNLSLKGSQAGTAMQAMFSTLQNKQKQNMLLDIGVQLTEDGSYRNVLDIIEDIKEKTKGMEKAQRESFISQVFQEQGSQAMNRLLAIPKEELDTLINEVKNSDGFSKELANTLNNGLGGAFRNLKSATEGLAISIGEYLEPTIISLINGATQLISAGTGFIEWLNSGSYVANTLTFTISALTAGFVAYKAVLIATTMWEKVATFWGGALGVASKILAAAKMRLAGALVVSSLAGGGFASVLSVIHALLLPITGTMAIIIGAVVGLGTGFYMLYKKSERFRNGVNALISPLKKLWDWIKKFSVVGAIIDFGKNVYNKAKDFVTAGTQGKTNEETEKEIQDRINQVKNNPNQASNEVNAGTGQGVNTDYLLSSSGTSSSKIKHNGYYSKGAKNLTNNSNSTIYNNSNSDNSVYTSSAPVEKTIEEKMLDALLSIKNLLSSKGEKGNNKTNSNSQVVININKGDTAEDIISQVVEDLTIALGNV